MTSGQTAESGRTRRDALGQTCFLLHIAVMIFIVSGWAIASRGILLFYLVLLPGVVLQWQCNKSTCVLNNLESLIRNGRWRDSNNPEEGAWLLTLAKRAVGLRLTSAQMDGLIYAVMVLLWGLGLAHFFRA